VLSYATADQLTPTRRTVFAVRTFAILHLLAGNALIAWAIGIIMSEENARIIAVPMAGAGMMHVAIGVQLFRRRPGSWTSARVLLAILLLPALAGIVFGVVLWVIYHKASGWDQLSAAIGLVLAAISSGPYFLNLATLTYLMRPHPRAWFGVSVTQSFFARKLFMRTMAALWCIAALTVFVTWLT
jgi:hypothetical protein